MNETLRTQSYSATVLLLILSASAVGIAIPSAEAQVPVFTVSGTVYGADYKPLSGAAVTVLRSDGTSAGTDTTDSAGAYSIGGLVSGTYNVSAAHACCEKQFIPVTVSGTDPTVQQNFRLAPASGAPPIQDARVLKGVARDPDGKPLAGVFIEVYNYAYGSGDGNYYIRAPNQQYFTTTTGADGAYSLSLAVGSINLNAFKEDFDRLHASFEMKDNRTLDLPMRKSAAQSVTLQGAVRDMSGSPIAGAWINAGPDYQCGGDVCAMPVSDEGGRQEGDVWFYYEPQHGRYNNTQADKDGKYTMKVAAGNYRVTAWAEQHRQQEKVVSAQAGETKTVDFQLQRIPDDSVRLHGTVLDAKTGKGIPYASVSVENQQWGSHHYTMTKDDGSFELMVKPGYLIVTASADRWYYMPCGSGGTATATAKASGGAEPEPDYAVAPESPRPCDGGRERDQEYFTRAATLTAAEKDEKQLDLKLTPRPTPDATFLGYVVNSSSQKAVPGATVTFFNEFTRDWGQATTDENGGYKIRVHAGYYTVRVYAEHYYDTVVNAEIRGGEDQRLDLQVVPGEKAYGYGMVYGRYSTGAMEDGGKGGAPMMGAPMPRSTSASSAASGSESGQAVYEGEADSGLGEYRPYAGSKGTSPAPVGLLVLASLGAIALALRRRNA